MSRSIFSTFLVSLSILLLTPAGLAQDASVDRPIADKWALIIGIDRFQDSRIPTLQYSSKDARDFADFLVKKGNFASDHVLLLLNEDATSNKIQAALGDKWLPKRAMR